MPGLFHTWTQHPPCRSVGVLGALVLATGLLMSTVACERADKIVLTPEQEKIVQAHILTQEPEPAFKVGATLGKSMELIGYDLAPETIRPGAMFTITWYWRCLEEVSRDWMPFVHMDSHMAGPYRLNLDHHPVNGLHRTSMWEKGQIIKDEQRATFPANFPEGEVIIWTGAFRGEERLKVKVKDGVKTDGQNRIRAGSITLAPNEVEVGKLPSITAWKAGSPIKVDGVLDEEAWSKAASTGYWVTPNGTPITEQRTRAKVLWDDQYLYLGIECEDDDIWSDFTKRDENLWEQEVVEVFLQPDSASGQYAEIQVSPAGVLFDAVFDSYRSDLTKAKAKNLDIVYAVKVDGTLNKRDDQDRGWVVELAIPLTQLPNVAELPGDGAQWRLNMFRLDAPKGKRQQAGAWSPPKVGDFHALHRFGHLIFKDSVNPNNPDLAKGAVQGGKLLGSGPNVEALKGRQTLTPTKLFNPKGGGGFKGGATQIQSEGKKPEAGAGQSTSGKPAPAKPGSVPRAFPRPVRPAPGK